ncbi:MAG: amidohydrolase family protein [Rhizobiaceae bacterium]|nr:amidohydrolase family protein [Hyphomicrobiales bacterium]NRB29036.1 amidohydrolase family protein [Rhizobiaceae bacterium]
MVRAAATHGLALDFHVDEGLADGLDGLETIADAVIETGYDGPILCGHACSLMNFGGDDLKRLADKLRRANITIASLPVTNLYLQGRGNGTPDRRGVTRIHELQEFGVSVIIGTDNVRDAFSPLGQHKPLESLKHAVLAAHLDPPFAAHLPMITTDAERALGLSPTFIDGASVADLIVFDAANLADLLSEPPAPIPLSTYLAEPQEGEIA